MTTSDQHAGPSEPSERALQRGIPTSGAGVPKYPMLGANVELLGEMQDTGFKESQWLVRRGETFIQLTELLYRVAEQANGEKTHEEIAESVTHATEWLVSAENVRQLLESKLIPLGLISSAREGEPKEGLAVERSPSPLRLNARKSLLGPGTIDPIAKVLQVLFAPFILVPVLLGVIFAHGWLYVVHGMGGALREVIYAPGLILALIGILLISSIFHEFGHASALRYGGGRARGMGFGLYLVFPALYTDTTESYRLGRWARVRTDLGGFYFHLIFAVGLMYISLLTGWDWLLVAVLLISLDIVYQCMPFVRFDGYWALADLTGIPDFFSQMGAFLRSVLPVPGWKGAKLPNLKTWVKGVFAAYIIVTVPVLALLLALLISRLPVIAKIAWYSLLSQTAALSQALDNWDVVGMALSVAQILILGLQMLGIVYLLYRIGRMIVRVVFKRVATRWFKGEGA